MSQHWCCVCVCHHDQALQILKNSKSRRVYIYYISYTVLLPRDVRTSQDKKYLTLDDRRDGGYLYCLEAGETAVSVVQVCS